MLTVTEYSLLLEEMRPNITIPQLEQFYLGGVIQYSYIKKYVSEDRIKQLNAAMKKHEQLVAKVIEEIKQHPFPPVFDKSLWEKTNANCYLYALNAYGIPNLGELGICLPGVLVHKLTDPLIPLSIILYYLQFDVARLGCELLSCEDIKTIRPDSYNIAMYRARSGTDLHFRRQDNDGQWSEKSGWDGEIRKVESSNLKNYYSPEIGIYDLVMYFTIQKK